ncbi:uncharacterized protein LOC113769345 [Coffea eugenioides]|uniref:uncharacterized protein LOC113769345 n=1 Tax=Coffea eugenioides TaxID=49369 RepID=UPI000F615566|nr:uncharacterized protein LOC113769345 [Coffea eugenioides]
MANAKTQEGRISGIKISRRGPSVTHLFFADDSLIFCKASCQEAHELTKILRSYEQASGQMINLDKSSAFFSKNVNQKSKEAVCSKLEGIQQVAQGKYLGLPMVVTRSKKQLFGYIKENIERRMQNWKSKLLSSAGKEILIKAVSMAIPTYTMSCFKLRCRLCKDICSLLSKFWWGEQDNKGKIHWVAWEKLTKEKKNGGLGFKDLQSFNRALLAKQIWRIIRNPNLLSSKVLKAKYFPNSCIQESKAPKNASWWNRPLIFKTFCKEDAHNILKIPISITGRYDNTFWTRNINGEYTVQCGYKMEMEKKEEVIRKEGEGVETSFNSVSQQVWKVLWSLNISYKVKMFIWKCLSDAVPVKELIWRRIKRGDPICSVCGEEVETLEHMLLKCSKVQDIWKLAPIHWDGIAYRADKFKDWWAGVSEARYRIQGKDHIGLTAYILWQIWKSRNNNVFNNKDRDPAAIINKACRAWGEFENATGKARHWRDGKIAVAQQQRDQEEEQPEHATGAGITLRIAVQWSKEDNIVGYGIVAYDGTQQELLAWGMKERAVDSQLQDLAEGVKLAQIKAAAEQGWRLINIGVPDKNLLQQIQQTKPLAERIVTVVQDIRELSSMFYKCSFYLDIGNTNDLSFQFSAQALSSHQDTEWVNPNLMC